MAKTRRAYTGGAASTTTSSVIAASGTTSFTITAYTGWPYGSDPFFVVVEPGTANEEKILVTRTGSTDTTINVYATPSVAANRGADGTSSVAHSSGVTVFPVFTALDADEANELTSAFGSKGDLVSYGSSTFETLGVGSDDAVLIADSGEASGLKWGSVDTAQLADDAVTTAKIDASVPLGARNLVYNGAMQVAQRGTSSAGITGSGYYTADRWALALGNLGTWTQSVETDAPTGSGFSKSLKMLCTTADAAPSANDLVLLVQKFEGQDLQQIKKGTSAAEQLTVSFWVKSNVTGTFIADLYDYENTRGVSASYSVAASGTWEKKTVTFPADTTGAFTSDNTDRLHLRFWLGAGSDYTTSPLQTAWNASSGSVAAGQTNVAAATNNYWQITGVQLELGNQATAFDHLPFGVELARCQRYYAENKAYVRSATTPYTSVELRPRMRGNPTTGGGGAGFTVLDASPSLVLCYQTSTAMQTLTFSAEL